MPRYIKQRDKYRCGPIAILNALRWAGVHAPYEDYRDPLTEMSGCKYDEGTSHSSFDRALREAGEGIYRVRRVHRPKLGQIRKHLKEGGAIILNYYWQRKEEYSRHFSLLAGISDNGRKILTVNDFRGNPAKVWCSTFLFRRRNLRFQSVDKSYKGWFLTKVEE